MQGLENVFQEIKPGGRGGSRPGAGRKPDPAETKEQKRIAHRERVLFQIRVKRTSQKARDAKKLKKPQRDPRFIQEEQECWEWLMRRPVVAAKRKSQSVSDAGMVTQCNSQYYYDAETGRHVLSLKNAGIEDRRHLTGLPRFLDPIPAFCRQGSGNTRVGHQGGRQNLS